MKTAGDILSAIFDERFVKKAQGYSKFFDSWTDITAKNGIPAAADHSRIKDLDRGIVLIEMDHPGWKQILQTKQSKFLNDFRIRFPELDITGVALMLGKSEPYKEENDQNEIQEEKNAEIKKLSGSGQEVELAAAEPIVKNTPAVQSFDSIEDGDFKETLKKLGQTIADREKKN
jgi:hypothetical protein